jgi:hypothetical protein
MFESLNIINFKIMRTKVLALLLISAVACSKKEEAPMPAYSFKNQEVSGKINNVAWAYADGFADLFSSGSEPKVDIKLFLAQPSKGCNVVSVSGNQVFFFLPAKIGLYPLSFNLSGGASYTATLFEKATTLNIIASTGAIEILTLSSTEVTGRIDARSDDKSFVNGNFKIAICP